MLTRAVLLVLGVFTLTAVVLNWGADKSDQGRLWRELTVRFRGKEKDRVSELLKADPVDRTALVRALRHEAKVAREEAEDVIPALRDVDGDDNGTGEDEAGGGDGKGDGESGGGAAKPGGDADADAVAGSGRADAGELLKKSSLAEAERGLFLKYWETLRASKPDIAGAVAVLEAGTVSGSAAIPLTMAGDVMRRGTDFREALKLYEKAGALPDGIEGRRRALDLAVVREWPETLERLMAVSGYREALESSEDERLAIRVAQDTRDAGALMAISVDHILEGLRQPQLVLVSLLTAMVWFISLHKACRIPLREWWIGGVGLLLGVGSVAITLLFLMLQESHGGLAENGTADNDFVFYLAGVGLREEGAKLICFLPMLFLLRKRTPGLALVAASCVGLGFAMEENLTYYRGAGIDNAVGRFVSANFMHVAMTGLLGHALFRFWRYPKNYGPAFMATFVLMVVVHGFYDFCLSGYSVDAAGLPMFLLAGLAWYYFQTMRAEQAGAPQVITAYSVFLVGSAVLVGFLLNCLVADFGWQISMLLLWPAVLSVVLLNALFVWFLREL